MRRHLLLFLLTERCPQQFVEFADGKLGRATTTTSISNTKIVEVGSHKTKREPPTSCFNKSAIAVKACNRKREPEKKACILHESRFLPFMMKESHDATHRFGCIHRAVTVSIWPVFTSWFPWLIGPGRAMAICKGALQMLRRPEGWAKD